MTDKKCNDGNHCRIVNDICFVLSISLFYNLSFLKGNARKTRVFNAMQYKVMVTVFFIAAWCFVQIYKYACVFIWRIHYFSLVIRENVFFCNSTPPYRYPSVRFGGLYKCKEYFFMVY